MSLAPNLLTAYGMTRINKLIIFTMLSIISTYIFTSCASFKTHEDSQRSIIARFATNMLDRNYVYSGTAPSEGFDCSGLVYYAYKEAGIIIPRTTDTQYKKARKIELKYAKEGDLLFFSTSGTGATHVGIYLGDGKFIHAPSQGKKVRKADVETKYWKNNLYGAATFFQP